MYQFDVNRFHKIIGKYFSVSPVDQNFVLIKDCHLFQNDYAYLRKIYASHRPTKNRLNEKSFHF